MRERQHIGFLHHILRLKVVVDHAPCDTIKPLVVPLHDRPERAAVFRDGAGNQIHVVVAHIDCSDLCFSCLHHCLLAVPSTSELDGG